MVNFATVKSRRGGKKGERKRKRRRVRGRGREGGKEGEENQAQAQPFTVINPSKNVLTYRVQCSTLQNYEHQLRGSILLK